MWTLQDFWTGLMLGFAVAVWTVFFILVIGRRSGQKKYDRDMVEIYANVPEDLHPILDSINAQRKAYERKQPWGIRRLLGFRDKKKN